MELRLKPKTNFQREVRNEGKKEKSLEATTQLLSHRSLITDIRAILQTSERDAVSDEATKFTTYLHS